MGVGYKLNTYKEYFISNKSVRIGNTLHSYVEDFISIRPRQIGSRYFTHGVCPYIHTYAIASVHEKTI